VPIDACQHQLDNLLGPVELLNGESLIQFEQLLSEVIELVKPRDIFEEIWIREVALDTWEAHRLRRHKNAFWNKAAVDERYNLGSERIELNPSEYEELREEDGSSPRADPEAQTRAEAQIKEHNESDDDDLEAIPVETVQPRASDYAKGWVRNIGIIEKFDERISAIEFIRISTLREIERRREAQARLTRIPNKSRRYKKEAQPNETEVTSNDELAQDSR
jgi:hypothetical protein